MRLWQLPVGHVNGSNFMVNGQPVADLANIDKDEEELKTIAYSYVFANGFTEPTVVIITDAEDDKDGYTLQVEPLSGRVRLSGEIVDWKDTFGFLPDLPPQLPD